MSQLDFVVLGVYFLVLILIGYICSRGIKKQEDFFLGGRGFGKLLQTFAAFGAGTGSQDPITLGRTTWTSGLSGIWSALNWLFVTPFYWIFAVWYRRMRHLTLGDWFVERYESKPMGAAYTLFAFSFQILYLSIMFSAIGKFVEPLLGEQIVTQLVETFRLESSSDLKLIMIPAIALVVLAYGILGGLTAAYWTDLIQGLFIILLSIILIPTGLNALVTKYADSYPELEGSSPSMLDGFYIMHQRLSGDFFKLFDTPISGEFPIHFIIVFAIMSLVGIVVQPHMIATGGGSAKTEFSARFGLVTGNFLKRLCTVGWAVTGLIALTLFAGTESIANDPDQVWGVASREILQPLGFGLVGLMLACLLAALMSSADCYMIVGSALLVKNVYSAYIHPNASDRTYILVGRIAGFLMISGAAFVSIQSYNVLEQYFMALEVALAFAAPFWLGMYWRGATTSAAWATIAFSVFFFFVGPYFIPKVFPELANNKQFQLTSHQTTTKITRDATAVDVEKRMAKIEIAKKNESQLPLEIEIGDSVDDTIVTGNQSIFWTEGIVQTTSNGFELAPVREEIETTRDGNVTITKSKISKDQTLLGKGQFRMEFLIYHLFDQGLTKLNVQPVFKLETLDSGMLKTLRLPPRILAPFFVMILISWLTKKNRKEALDRYYVKMKTPVNANPTKDAEELEVSYSMPQRFDSRKLFPNSNLEIQKPRFVDLAGFLVAVLICFLFVQVILWLAKLGS